MESLWCKQQGGDSYHSLISKSHNTMGECAMKAPEREKRTKLAMLGCILVQEETSRWVGAAQQYLSSSDFLILRAATSATTSSGLSVALTLTLTHTHTQQPTLQRKMCTSNTTRRTADSGLSSVCVVIQAKLHNNKNNNDNKKNKTNTQHLVFALM